jgi:hypothetical protein
VNSIAISPAHPPGRACMILITVTRSIAATAFTACTAAIAAVIIAAMGTDWDVPATSPARRRPLTKANSKNGKIRGPGRGSPAYLYVPISTPAPAGLVMQAPSDHCAGAARSERIRAASPRLENLDATTTSPPGSQAAPSGMTCPSIA